MGDFANDVTQRLMQLLSKDLSEFNWESEYRIGGKPVDIVGVKSAHYILVELEWHRADPADNVAGIFRQLTK